MELTDRTWHVIRQARDEAIRLGDELVGSDHLLLSILRDADGAAASLLADLGVSFDAVNAQLLGDSRGVVAPTGS